MFPLLNLPYKLHERKHITYSLRKPKQIAVMKPPFKGQWEQPGRIGVAVSLRNEEGCYWTYREWKEFGGSDQKYFNYHAFYVGYNVTNVVYSTTEIGKRSGGLHPEIFSQLHSLQRLKMTLGKHHYKSFNL